MNLIEQIEKAEIDRLVAERPIPEFAPGDTVRVHFRVVEGTRERIQVYEGVVIARSNKGLNSAFTVRKISYGEGVERVFPLYSPRVEKIEVARRGAVRRAKLYYLRGRRGKSARIAARADRPGARPDQEAPAAPEPEVAAPELEATAAEAEAVQEPAEGGDKDSSAGAA